jgi:hypothetical protein
MSILYIIHRSVFYLKYVLSETGFCLRLQVERNQVAPIGRASLCLRTSCIYWTHLSKLHLKTETESSLRNVVF